MIIKSNAKINISLDVVGKREDGYHLLKMIMQSIDLTDELDIELTKDNKILLSCNKKYISCGENNIIYKACQLFMNETENFGVKIHLNKNIPVSAGLAGGSSNAAATLIALNELRNYPLSDEKILDLGLKLGADVPFCIIGGTCLCEGIGEIITPLKSFAGKTIVLIKPPFGVSTKDVFKALDIKKIKKHPDTDSIIKAIENDDLITVSSLMKNVLENVTLNKHKILQNIKDTVRKYNPTGVLMSGSGPTIFAFFEDNSNALRCFEYFRSKYKEVFITKTV